MYSLQERLDRFVYPPTHTYDIDSLTPKSVLSERVSIIIESFPEFFDTAESFLDIGCNKGFFSFYGCAVFKKVLGLDPVIETIDICREIASVKGLPAKFLSLTFKEYIAEIWERELYNRVFIGNGLHYLFKDSYGWAWVDKLSAIVCTDGLVLLGGPTGMECKDMYIIPNGLKSEFTREKLVAVMSKRFTQVRSFVDDCKYTPDRYLSLWKKSP